MNLHINDKINLNLESLVSDPKTRKKYEDTLEMANYQGGNNINSLNYYDDVEQNSLLHSPYDNREGFCTRMYKFITCYKRDINQERCVTIDYSKPPQGGGINVENVVKNQKYNIITFIPIVLFDQFKFFFNLFFLLIALSQFIQVLQVGFLFTYIAPLVLVLTLTMIKEGYDDFQRYKRDNEANSTKYTVITKNGRRIFKPSSKLKVGDVIEVKASQRVPADLILLYSSEPNGTIFIKTDQLDGETDWKLRRAIRFTQQYFQTDNNKENILNGMNAQITYHPPSENIYEFEGLFDFTNESSEKFTEVLTIENTLWANTVVTSGYIMAIVIFTGKETRSRMNNKKPRSKIGKLDQELNFISKLLFLFMIILAFFIVILNGFYAKWYLQLFRYTLLMSSIIPISLRVNLDFAKAIFSYKIAKDPVIPGAVARNSNIPEELGRIEFLLSDKTGTLTKNEMHFKKLVMEHYEFDNENLSTLAKILIKECQKNDGPMKDVHEKYVTLTKNTTKNFKFRREKEPIIRDFITGIAVCHNVTPIFENGNKIFHASSPDEIALVNFAQSIKMKLIDRDNDNIRIENANGIMEDYQVIANFPFSSETKRMGILLKHINSQRIIFYLKGADIVIQHKVKEVYKSLLMDECENLARTGLRTMAFASKYIPEWEFIEWKKLWDDANSTLQNRNEKIKQAAEMLESDMDFLGITGIEDKLQNNINDTLESLRNAGIKIWMLTGDKVETAKCVAISAGLKTMTDSIFEIKDIQDDLQIINKINEFSNKVNSVLLIDSGALSQVLEKNQAIFFEVALRAPAVICCRCLPSQKAQITEAVRKYSGSRVACVGDGGNDVSMIQTADVGIGIVGKEGMQASLASDFSIPEFQYLKHLILWNGRLYYKNSAKMSQFVIHRGLIISFIQAIFMLTFYFVAIPIYNGMLMLGYTTIYTMFPVFCLIFDEDVDYKTALSFPILYKTLQKGRELSSKTFLIWVWKSLFQAAVIMLLTLQLFQDSFLQVVTITFSALIVSEILNVYTELHKLHPVMIISQIGTLIVYILSIFFFRTYINVDKITPPFAINVLIIVGSSWLPVHIIKIFHRCLDPSDYEKVMSSL